jgi:hypothetical protein
MGKIDDMRRQREQQFAERQRGANPRASEARADIPGAAAHRETNGTAATHAPIDEAPVDAPKRERLPPKRKISAKSRAAADVQGKCPICGKTRAVTNGLLAFHQKGLGKPCSGSRKKPA